VIQLFDNGTGELLGTIDREELKFLIDQLEEEGLEDQDYFINRATLEMFEEEGCPPHLLDLIVEGLGEREELEIRWETE
jgi:hypothetical protein